MVARRESAVDNTALFSLDLNSQDPISGEELLVADLSYEVRLLSVEERYNLKSENELAGEVEDHL